MMVIFETNIVTINKIRTSPSIRGGFEPKFSWLEPFRAKNFRAEQNSSQQWLVPPLVPIILFIYFVLFFVPIFLTKSAEQKFKQIILMKNSNVFDTWVTETVGELENFTGNK